MEQDPSPPELEWHYASERDKVLHAMCKADWKFEEDGFIDSPQGYFFLTGYYLHDVPDIVKAFSDRFVAANFFNVIQLTGHFVVIEKQLETVPYVEVERYRTIDDALAAFQHRQAAFRRWMGQLQ